MTQPVEMVGTVTKLCAKPFGFIRSDSYPSVFFHANDLLPPLDFSGALLERRVRFQLEENERGMRASNVRLAD